ncbi:hypothetical protein [Nitrospirillum viridazoti]|uniref:Uncharacterized protein n=1 Tax=Nitrospirillum amazonense TaxID=28077 RepID=A0A560IK79_9PROT|nr:hypothetical protein [Nitrospirillum amazonense]TWB58701.1 hypothetical protein FBZ92_109194 [Nitrospirillum amazonense]
MSFEEIKPIRGSGRGVVGVAVSFTKDKSGARTLRVVVSGVMMARLGWKDGVSVRLGGGAAGSADYGKLRIWPDDTGMLRVKRTSKLSQSATVITRALHPSWVSIDLKGCEVKVLEACAEQLIVQLPKEMVRQSSSIMGEAPARLPGR